jgi:hypothetical protein
MPRRPNVTTSGLSFDRTLARRPYWNQLPGDVRTSLITNAIGGLDKMFNYSGATVARGVAVPQQHGGRIPTAGRIGGRGKTRKVAGRTPGTGNTPL